MSMTEEGDPRTPLAVIMIRLSREQAVLLSFLPKQVLHHFESMQNVGTFKACKRELQERIICVLA